MSDELSGIFDHLTPEDFEGSSAVHEQPNTKTGPVAFGEFVDEGVRTMRTAFAASNGEYLPVAFLVSPTTRRLFRPEHDELLQDYLARLNREGGLMGATWTFISMVVDASTYEIEDDEDPRAIGDPEVVAEAERMGLLRKSLIYYAERREDGDIERRQGVLTVVGNSLAKHEPWDAEQESPFRWILGGVPNV